MSFIGTKPETFNIFGLIILESGHREDSYNSATYDVSFYKQTEGISHLEWTANVLLTSHFTERFQAFKMWY